MHRIDTSTAQKDKFGAGKNGFTAGNPQTGTPATDLDDDYFDMLQEELAGVVEATGVNLDKSKHNQLLTALKALLLSRAHPFADIKADGTAAIAEALSNLGLPNLFSQKANLNGDASQGFAVAGGSSPNSAVAYNQFQSGYNGNGAWTKLPGGGQWCRKNLTIAANSIITWTFPAAFGSMPALFLSTFNGAPNVWFNGASASGANLFNANSSEINVNVLAIW